MATFQFNTILSFVHNNWASVKKNGGIILFDLICKYFEKEFVRFHGYGREQFNNLKGWVLKMIEYHVNI